MPGKKGFGTKIDYFTSPSTWTELANVTKIAPFNLKVDSIDVTSQDSPDEYREKLPGLKDAGEASFDMNYDPAATTHIWLVAHAGGTVEQFRVRYAPGTTGCQVDTFSGFVSQIGPETPHDNKMNARCVINVTSKPVRTTLP